MDRWTWKTNFLEISNLEEDEDEPEDDDDEEEHTWYADLGLSEM